MWLYSALLSSADLTDNKNIYIYIYFCTKTETNLRSYSRDKYILYTCVYKVFFIRLNKFTDYIYIEFYV